MDNADLRNDEIEDKELTEISSLVMKKENELYEQAVDTYLDKTDADVIAYLSEEDERIYDLCRRYMSHEDLTSEELTELKEYLAI